MTVAYVGVLPPIRSRGLSLEHACLRLCPR
jgi:hypothetical protein